MTRGVQGCDGISMDMTSKNYTTHDNIFKRTMSNNKRRSKGLAIYKHNLATCQPGSMGEVSHFQHRIGTHNTVIHKHRNENKVIATRPGSSGENKVETRIDNYEQKILESPPSMGFFSELFSGKDGVLAPGPAPAKNAVAPAAPAATPCGIITWLFGGCNTSGNATGNSTNATCGYKSSLKIASN